MTRKTKTVSTQNIADNLVVAANSAASVAAQATTKQKNAVLQIFIHNLEHRSKQIETANKKDMAAAGQLSTALKERLLLNKTRIQQMANSVADIIALPDPVGEISEMKPRPSGIQVGKMRMPLGVILAIYESRPNVTADIGALAIKSGNAVILRGGSEARHSNAIIGKCLADALAKNNLPASIAQIVPTSERSLIDDLLRNPQINLAIPRGGRGLIERVAANACMPVLKHLDGNCHIYVDAAANADMARRVIINAKTRRYGVCSATESLLVHTKVAAKFLPAIAADLRQHGVEIRGCSKTQKIITKCRLATEDDWSAEYLAPIISVKVIANIDAAIAHINHYGSGHTDAILTDSVESGRRFLREVDSSSVLLNASTAFADGGEYGLGAEVGISTDKFHARGPVGLEGLTCQKYIVIGDGCIRD